MNSLLTNLRKHKVTISLVEGKLKINAPAGVLSKELLDEINRNKESLKEYLTVINRKVAYSPLQKAKIKPYYKLSSAQQRLYILHKMDSMALTYNMPYTIRMEGNLNPEQLRLSFEKLIARHHSLRTSFELIKHVPVQKIHETVDFEVNCFTATDRDTKDIVKKFIRPFKLDKAPLFRVGLIREAPSIYMLVIDMHHIISDGISQEILLREFSNLYNNIHLPENHLQYVDFAEWQHNQEQVLVAEKQKQYWLDIYNKEVQLLDLPLDYVRPVIQVNEGHSLGFTLSEQQVNALKNLADQENATLFMALLSLYLVLLSKLSGQEDIVTGIPVAGRRHPDLEQMIGMFVNTLPVRNYVDGELSFRELLHVVRYNALMAFDNQAYAYEDLLEALKLPRDPARNALFDTMFVYHNYEKSALTIPGLFLSPYDNGHRTAMTDITLTATERGKEIYCEFEYATHLFKQETIKKFIDYFLNLLEAVISDNQVPLKHIDLLGDEERRCLLYEFNATTIDFPDGEKTVNVLFEEQVDINPEATAIAFYEKELSYASLNEQANNLAHFLVTGVGLNRDELVMIHMDKCIEVVTAVLGIWKAGGTYVPVVMSTPENRLKFMLQDVRPRMIITTRPAANKLAKIVATLDFSVACLIYDEVTGIPGVPGFYNRTALEEYPTYPVMRTIDPDSLAYLIYTSGSTGTPKAVKVQHRAFTNAALAWRHAYKLSDQDISLLQVASIGFDVFAGDIARALINGGKMVLCPDELRLDFDVLAQLLNDHKVTLFESTPTLIIPLMDYLFVNDLVPQSLQLLIIGSDICRFEDFKRIATRVQGKMRVINSYGMTEATIDTSYYEGEALNMPNTGIVPVGKPMANMRMFILNKWMNLQPIAMEGEIVVAGKGVGAGYHNQPELTALKFVSDIFQDNQSMYRTGDRGKWLPDGNIQISGRMDEQVKIRGNRVELGEIESVLLAYESIEQAAVLLKSINEQQELVAYYVGSVVISGDLIRAYLENFLPLYMIPAYFVQLDSMPLTVNGKLDRKKMPEPVTTATIVTNVTPVSEEEEILLEVWRKVLKINNIGVTDNFFSHGGDSIKVIQIRSRVKTAGYEVSVKDMFTYQTIRELAPRLTRTTHVSTQEVITGKSTLTPIQKRYFDFSNTDHDHYNLSVMLHFREGVSLQTVSAIFGKIQEHHDALRMVFKMEGNKMIQENTEIGQPLFIQEHDLNREPLTQETMLEICNSIQAGMDIKNGPLMRLGLFQTEGGSRLLIVISHLVVDGVSWRILFEDINTLYSQIRNKQPLELPMKTDSFLSWSEQLLDYTKTPVFQQAITYWEAVLAEQTKPLTRDVPDGQNNLAFIKNASFTLTSEETANLLTSVHLPFNTQMNDILLAALLISVRELYGMNTFMIELESHGREELRKDINISRTVGWFSSLYPVLLRSDTDDIGGTIRQVKEILRGVPNNGIDYLIYKYMYNEEVDDNTRELPCLPVNFNYLGQFEVGWKNDHYSLAKEKKGVEMSMLKKAEYDWEITGQIMNGVLTMNLVYSDQQYYHSTVTAFMNAYQYHLRRIIIYCNQVSGVVLNPSDLTYKFLSVTQLDMLQEKYVIDDVYTLSPMQEGMLYNALLDTDSEQYFEQMTCRVEGELNIAIVQKSMNVLMERYEILRTIFIHEEFERPLQIVLKQREIEFLYKDIRHECKTYSKEQLITSYQQKDRGKVFRLDRDVLMRLTILQTGDYEYEFVWSHHHIIMDGWCMGIIMTEFRETYKYLLEGKTIELPLVKRYASYIEWLENRDKEQSLGYWRNYLDGYERLISVPGRMMGQDAYLLETQRFFIDKERVASLNMVSIQYGVTLNTLIQVAWGILLGKYNDVSDVVFGSVVSGRPADLDGIEKMVGLLINTVPVRVQYDADTTIGDLLKKMQAAALEGDQYHYQPLSEIQTVSAVGRELIDHVIVFENYPVPDDENSDESMQHFQITNIDVFEQTNYDLALSVVTGSEIEVKLDYNANTYDRSAISRISLHFKEVIDQIIADGNSLVRRIEIVSGQEKRQLLRTFNGSEKSYDLSATFVDLFEDSVARYPNNVAVVHNEVQLTYQDLNAWSNRIAAFLADSQVEKGDVIPLLIERGITLLACMIGVQKAGAAFVALDIRNPAERIRKIIRDCDPRLIIAAEAFVNLLPESSSVTFNTVVLNGESEQFSEYGSENKHSGPMADDLAYIVYTSGSTGEPKGVLLHHRGMTNHFKGLIDVLELTKEDCFGQTAECSFDVYIVQMLMMLSIGGCTRIIDREFILQPADLEQLLQEGDVTLIELVPSVIRAMLTEEGREQKALGLRWLISTGEQLAPELVALWYKAYPAIPVVNAYGPAETSDDATIYILPTDIDREKHVFTPIGKPLPNFHVYILNKDLQLCPLGVKGEICISGPGVGYGYWNNQEETSARFMTNPFLSLIDDDNFGRLYRTGDYGYYQEDGNIVCIGRQDDMVKVRGARIETGEVEKAITSMRGIEEAVVVVGKEEQLYAYFVGKEKQELSTVRKFVNRQLPAYMVPGHFMQLDSIPLTINGKVNRKALPVPDHYCDDKLVTPATPVEHKIADIWAKVLKLDKARIGVTQSFFELGGHSLKVAQLSGQIGKAFEIIVPLRELLTRQTIQEQAVYVETTTWLNNGKGDMEATGKNEITI